MCNVRSPCSAFFVCSSNGFTHSISWHHSCIFAMMELSLSPDISCIAVARPQRWACHLATAACWVRGVPERYVAGTDTRGRQEGWPYLWSQQVIHEISGLSRSLWNLPFISSLTLLAQTNFGVTVVEGEHRSS
jgi:hypothetical protein